MTNGAIRTIVCAGMVMLASLAFGASVQWAACGALVTMIVCGAMVRG